MKKWKRLLGSLTPQQLEPIEIRQAILDEIATLAQPLGDGRRGLVHNRILVRLRCADEARRSTIEGVLAGEEGLLSEVTRYLAERGCAVPSGFTIATEVGEPVAGVMREYEVIAKREPGRAATAQPRERTRPRAKLVMLADGAEIEIGRNPFFIGRVAEVREKDHRIVRRNQLSFGDAEASVSRAHAHIRYSPETGQYRIFDDRSARGTRVLSDGQPIDVSPGRSRGEQLRSGDEIYFGSVGARFEICE
jgi:pSer/pThr/pTyr-binding forkhead associated (FHA) protein